MKNPKLIFYTYVHSIIIFVALIIQWLAIGLGNISNSIMNFADKYFLNHV